MLPLPQFVNRSRGFSSLRVHVRIWSMISDHWSDWTLEAILKFGFVWIYRYALHLYLLLRTSLKSMNFQCFVPKNICIGQIWPTILQSKFVWCTLWWPHLKGCLITLGGCGVCSAGSPENSLIEEPIQAEEGAVTVLKQYEAIPITIITKCRNSNTNTNNNSKM